MIYTGYVAASAKDWDEVSASTAVTLAFVRTNDADGVPTVDAKAHVLLSTSAITTGGTVTAATFYWKHSTLDSSKPMTVGIWNSGTSLYDTVYSGFGGSTNAVISATTTASTLLANINSSGGSETKLLFSCTVPTANLSRTCKVYSYDTSYTAAPYVVISYNDPVVATKRRIFFIT